MSKDFFIWICDYIIEIVFCAEVKMSWIYLLIASFFEVGWPVGLKLAEISAYRIWWIIVAAVAMTLSGIFLYLAQREIPIGTAYAVWSGVGASCTFIIGVLFFHDTATLLRCFGVCLIVGGVVLLKYGH